MESVILDNPEIAASSESIKKHTLTRTDNSGEFEQVQTSDTFSLAIVCPALEPIYKPTKEEILIVDVTTGSIQEYLEMIIPSDADDKLIALDLETEGVNCLNPAARIAGVGMTSAYGTIYFHTLNWKDGGKLYKELFAFLSRKDLEFIGYNVMFDASWLVVKMKGFHVNWKFDAYAIYRQLASEGYGIQNSAYGLKRAQLDLLGWESKGDVELDLWLITHGYHKGVVKAGTSAEQIIARYHAGTLKPKKGMMSRAPSDILGYYCGLDTYSTRALFTDIFIPSIQGKSYSDAYWDYHALFMRNLTALVEQYLNGIRIDTERMQEHLISISAQTQEAKQRFLTHPDIAPHIRRYRDERLAQYRAREPARYLAPPALGTEPGKYTKKNNIAKTWLSWDAKRKKIEAFDKTNPEWIEWQRKYKALHDDELFNIDSAPMKQWLFFGQLKMESKALTPTGKPSVGKSATKSLGIYGEMLTKYNLLHKETQMTKATLAVVRDNRIHPQFKAPGTFTGRLAGGSTEADDESLKFNIQQIPKRKEYLSCWVPDPGTIFVDCDHSALEPVVLTALSKDQNMLKLYGPNAKKGQDIYLFVGANLPKIGKKIRDTGYDPEFPTVESLAIAKRECKKERAIAKTIVLGATYGMGPNKLRQTLFQEGINMSESESFALHDAYWNLFKGVKRYGYALQEKYYSNGGWVLNAVGRPVCCDERQLKDIQNRVIQSSGHDIHMMFIDELLQLRTEVDFWYDGIIWDFHDQSIVQVPEERAGEMVQVYLEAYKRMNKKLRTMNPDFILDIKGEPAIVPTLSEAKVQE